MMKIAVIAKGSFCNQWPLMRLQVNGQVLWDQEVRERMTIEVTVPDPKDSNTLVLTHHGKRFGEDGVWDTDIEKGLDRIIEIEDLQFDGHSIQHLRGELMFRTAWNQTQLNDPEFVKRYDFFACHGTMSFNGDIELEFEMPIMNWLTMAKFKRPISSSTAYFSGYDLRWHYDEPRQLINEIKELMRFD